jgi:excisionase family DNA binding protein
LTLGVANPAEQFAVDAQQIQTLHYGFIERITRLQHTNPEDQMATNITPILTEASIASRMFLRPREVAKLTGLSESEVYRSIHAGDLAARKYRTRGWLIAHADLDAWINACSAPSAA